MSKRQNDKGRQIGKCECGGIVRGVEQFDRLWTWCEKCSPVVKVTAPSVTRPDRGTGAC